WLVSPEWAAARARPCDDAPHAIRKRAEINAGIALAHLPARPACAMLAAEARSMAMICSTISISPQLTFDAIIAAERTAPLVLLLHGFAESMHCWGARVQAVGDAGSHAIAPSQRGYSPAARPDTNDFPSYHIDRLMDDAMAIAAASGYGEARFHLAGHDW